MLLGAADWWGADDRSMTVANNDVAAFQVHQVSGLAQADGVRRPPAHYWLGRGTLDNLVVGQGGATERVLDLGTDNAVQNALHIQQGKPDDTPGLSLKEDGPLLNLAY